MRRTIALHAWMSVLMMAIALWVMGCAAKQARAVAPTTPQQEPRPAQSTTHADEPPRASASASPAADGTTGLGMAAPAASNPASAKPSASPASPGQAKSGDGKDAPQVDPGNRPMLIYEAQLGVLVDESKWAATIERIIDIAESAGGYMVGRADQTVSVRVPSARLRTALADIERLGTVTRRSVTAQDVSDQYHDLDVRLKSLEAVRDRLAQFLSRASNMSEAMTIAAQLDQVAQQIDQVKGQMQLLRTRAAFSLIQVQLQPTPRTIVSDPAQQPPKTPAPRPAPLPVEWLHRLGLDSLTQLDDER